MGFEPTYTRFAVESLAIQPPTHKIGALNEIRTRNYLLDRQVSFPDDPKGSLYY